MRRTAAAVLVTIAAVSALSGCTLLTSAAKSGPDPTPSSSSYLPGASPTSPIDDGEIAAAPEAGPDSQQDAIEAATEAMKTFAQPQLGADEWWAQMLPLLSQQGGVAYEGTDPARIPARQVTGAAIVLADSTDVSLIVQVPTDVGPYNITLTRPNASAPWLADRIRPAQG